MSVHAVCSNVIGGLGIMLVSFTSVFAQSPSVADQARAALADSAAAASANAPVAQVPVPAPSSVPRVGEVAGTRIGGFLVGSFTYNSRIQMVPEFAGGAQALTPAGETNFRFDKFGIGAYRAFGPWLSANAAIEVERHRDAHVHGFAPGFGCPGTALCIERFGAETPVTEAVLDRFAITGRIPVGNGLYASVGRFDVPFGIEKHDEPLNVTATTSELFQFGRAQRMTGLQANYVFNPTFDLNVWWVNRWESETTHTPFDDNNSGKSVGARFGVTPYSRERLLNIGVGFFYGPEQNLNNDDQRWLFDADFVAAPSAQLFVAGEFAVGAEENISFRRRGSPFPRPAVAGSDVNWSSGYVVAHQDAAEWLGLNIRYGFIQDEDGYRTGIDQTLQSITLGPMFHLSALDPDSGTTGAAYGRTRHPIHWLDLKVEYRLNFSDEVVFSAMRPSIDITDATKKSHQLQVQFVLNF